MYTCMVGPDRLYQELILDYIVPTLLCVCILCYISSYCFCVMCIFVQGSTENQFYCREWYFYPTDYTGDEQGDRQDGRAGNHGNGSGSSSNLRNVNDDRRLE